MATTNNIVIQLQGGLGNQLFQYAYGRYLEIVYKKNVKTDVTFFENNFRSFKLAHLNTKLSIAEKSEVRNSKSQKSKFIPWKINNSIYVEDELFNFNYKIKKINNGYFIGYWPRTEHLNDIFEYLKTEIKIIDDLKCNRFYNHLNLININESIGIHIRRGDYLEDKNKKIFSILNKEYYLKAINYMNKHINNGSFYIFTDDIDWVKSQEWLKLDNITHVVFEDNNADIKEFELLKNCKHHIFANSTFSWWAAYLNSNESSINIGPSQWYNNKTYQSLYTNNKIFNSNFIKIN
jgi:hypothetical protein